MIATGPSLTAPNPSRTFAAEVLRRLVELALAILLILVLLPGVLAAAPG